MACNFICILVEFLYKFNEVGFIGSFGPKAIEDLVLIQMSHYVGGNYLL